VVTSTALYTVVMKSTGTFYSKHANVGGCKSPGSFG